MFFVERGDEERRGIDRFGENSYQLCLLGKLGIYADELSPFNILLKGLSNTSPT